MLVTDRRTVELRTQKLLPREREREREEYVMFLVSAGISSQM